MTHLKLAARLESLGLPFRAALREASRIGAAGAQLDAAGDFAPDRLSQSGRRELRTILRAHDLELAALGCPLRRGLGAAEDQEPRLEHVRKVMDLAFELGPRLVLVEAGAIPEKDDEPDARRLREALAHLAAHGDRTGVTLALVTGLEAGAALAAYLGTFDTGSLAACLDPANLLLRGLDPPRAVRDLAGRLAYVVARDARKASASRAAGEVALGHGDIDWMAFTEALGEVEYRGWLAVAREAGERRVADIEAGVALLRRFTG